ncbi:unnamed protein product [Rotaria magnacalcarata]|uniref:Coiled-coil domain-containing protein 61 n=1 Tax=Rotaria magnacalcarata TaxID=392030 RepID=A0A815Q974_9BILA|nr:unnamed protein product [Rotaria magnacalcarata]CAF1684916.1 unnamed protein product [Rotaria magnacalcarata]CAF1944537.1 unnamed protein product [Rotaria magnacalcarata]CAF2091888.1 unnamed protein product [Rotaria magnacalcarata]CAF2097734.1 unnamed protein product [Rotaria magnacalcarata]
MKDSLDLSTISPGISESSSLKNACSNEIVIRNQPYIISMSLHNSKQPQMDLEVEAKESADQWKASFDVTAIETMTAKTGNFKSFSVFVNMLENAINQESSAVSIDLFTYDDLETLRKKRQGQAGSITHHPANIQLANKRYLILTYNAEYDRIYYPLSLPYCGKPDPVILMQQIRQLTAENCLLKSRLESDVERSDIIRIQRECTRLKKENNEFRQQLASSRPNNSKDQQQQIELLRQMIRTSEDALVKERAKTTTTKTDDYRLLNDQIDSLKTSERQLKSKVRCLTNEIALMKRNTLHHHPTTVRSSSKERPLHLNGYSPRSFQQQQRPPSLSRPSSGDQRRHRSDHLLPTASSRNRSKHRSNSNDSRRSGSGTRPRSSSLTKRSPSPADSRGRFNPTAYIHEKNLKLRQIEIQKSRETRRRRSVGRHGSDSDLSDFSARGGSKAASITSLKLNDSDDGLRISASRRSSSRKRTSESNQYKSKDSTDSDIEGVPSSPPSLRKSASNNPASLISHKSHHHSSSDHDQQNINLIKTESTNVNDMVDIDERLKSLEKFMKENLPS